MDAHVVTLDLEIPAWDFTPMEHPAQIAYLAALEAAGFPIVAADAPLIDVLPLGMCSYSTACECGKTILGMPMCVRLTEDLRTGMLMATTIYYLIDFRFCDCVPF